MASVTSPTANYAADTNPTGRQTPRPQTVLLSVGNMHCSSCVKKIESALADFGDTVVMRADPTTRTLSLSWDASQVELKKLVQAIAEAGFTAQLVNIENGQQGPAPSLRRIGVAVLFTMQTMMLALAGYLGADGSDPLVSGLMNYGQWIAATPVVLYAGWPFIFGAWRDISSRQITMDLPVGLAITAAYCFSASNVLRGHGVLWFDSATMFVSLLLIARQIESSGRAAATRELSQLFKQQKNTARRMVADQPTEVPSSQISRGDVVEVHPAEAIPVDGVALTDGLVSESVLTGESTPRQKTAGDMLFAGSILVGTKALRLRTTANGAETTLGRISQMMHHALTSRPKVQQLADQVAGYFVLLVLGLAVSGGLLWAYWDTEKGISVGLTVLVASCPCALSLATPAALAAAMSRMAKRGMLVLKLDGLLKAKDVTHLVFDKTGTLTSDQLAISKVYNSGKLAQSSALAIAAGLESISHHPIASAFSQIDPAPITQGRVESNGVRGYYQSRQYQLRTSQASELSEFSLTAEQGEIYLSLCTQQQVMAIFCLTAPLRPQAHRVVQRLKQRGVQLHLLSGDASQHVSLVAQQLGIKAQPAGQTAADKLGFIQALQQQGHTVAAVGDGINDSPLLAAADLGIAMGSGSAQAKSGAGIILNNNDLNLICDVIFESKTLHQRIRQNISWAIGYNLTVFPLALSGTLAPWVAAIGMASSSILVISNALRRTAGSAAATSATKEATPCQL